MPYTADEQRAIDHSNQLNRQAVARRVRASQARATKRFGPFDPDVEHCSVCGTPYLRGAHHR